MSPKSYIFTFWPDWLENPKDRPDPNLGDSSCLRVQTRLSNYGKSTFTTGVKQNGLMALLAPCRWSLAEKPTAFGFRRNARNQHDSWTNYRLRPVCESFGDCLPLTPIQTRRMPPCFIAGCCAPGCVWRDKAFRNKNLSFAVQDVQDRQLIRSLIHVYRGPQAKQYLTVAAEEACISRS